MLISIAIPAFNEEKLLPSTLAAVTEAGVAFTDHGWEMEVVVCDNNSTDATAKIAEAAGAQVVSEKHNQISRARNAAGNTAKGEWIIFIDADSEPSKALFEATAVAMGKKEIIGGGATVQFVGGQAPFPFVIAERIWNGVSRIMSWPAGSYIFVEQRIFMNWRDFQKNCMPLRK